MKFLIMQENGKHEKNRRFRECFSVQKCLIDLGYSCDIFGKGHDLLHDLDFNNYDVIIDLENYDTGWIPNLNNIKSYKILWAIDGHCKGMEYYYNRFNSGKYQLILQATKTLVSNNSVWFPNCFNDNLVFPIDLEKRADVGFCGNILSRKPFLDILSKNFNFISDIFVIGDEMVRAVNSYKIHFNKNIGDDINYRSFETIGCKVVLSTNYNPQYEELGFEDGKNCIFYKNEQELVSKIRDTLYDKNLLDNISLNGYTLSKKHTYLQRIKYLESILKERI